MLLLGTLSRLIGCLGIAKARLNCSSFSFSNKSRELVSKSFLMSSIRWQCVPCSYYCFFDGVYAIETRIAKFFSVSQLLHPIRNRHFHNSLHCQYRLGNSLSRRVNFPRNELLLLLVNLLNTSVCRTDAVIGPVPVFVATPTR